MEFYPIRIRLILACLTLSIGLALQSGCSEDPNPDQGRRVSEESLEITAQEILTTVLAEYENAESYQDKAVLYLTYRLNGKAIQEPHPWSFSWNGSSQFAGDLFNTKIRCDGKRLSCYVFDIQSGNLDNQQIMKQPVPFSALLSDPIATHFMLGLNDLPLDEVESTSNGFFTNPLIGFCDANLLPSWLKEPTGIKRSADEVLDGNDCYLLELSFKEKTYRLWIDKQSGLIAQIQWPLHYLDSEILAAKEVENIRLLTRYHDSELNPSIQPELFEIQDRIATKNVGQFVRLPPAIPAEQVGRQIRSLKLDNPEQQPVDNVLSGKTMALLWLEGAQADAILEKYITLKSDNTTTDVEFGVVLPGRSYAQSGVQLSEGWVQKSKSS